MLLRGHYGGWLPAEKPRSQHPPDSESSPLGEDVRRTEEVSEGRRGRTPALIGGRFCIVRLTI